MRKRKQFNLGSASSLFTNGTRKIIDVDGKSIGLFNVDGDYYAMHNRCPHMAGPLCEGPVCGTALPVEETGKFVYGRDMELVRCGWHGWEFEIKTGVCLVDDKMRARTYEVTVQDSQLVLHM